MARHGLGRLTLFAGILVVAPMLLADSCTDAGTGYDTPTPFPTPKTINIAQGSVMKARDGFQATITSVAMTSAQPAFDTPLPKPTVCVTITIDVVNGSHQEWLSPLITSWNLIDQSGVEYQAGFTPDCSTAGPGVAANSLAAGGHASGTVSYEAPAGLQLRLSWAPQESTFPQETFVTNLTATG